MKFLAAHFAKITDPSSKECLICNSLLEAQDGNESQSTTTTTSNAIFKLLCFHKLIMPSLTTTGDGVKADPHHWASTPATPGLLRSPLTHYQCLFQDESINYCTTCQEKIDEIEQLLNQFESIGKKLSEFQVGISAQLQQSLTTRTRHLQLNEYRQKMIEELETRLLESKAMRAESELLTINMIKIEPDILIDADADAIDVDKKLGIGTLRDPFTAHVKLIRLEDQQSYPYWNRGHAHGNDEPAIFAAAQSQFVHDVGADPLQLRDDDDDDWTPDAGHGIVDEELYGSDSDDDDVPRAKRAKPTRPGPRPRREHRKFTRGPFFLKEEAIAKALAGKSYINPAIIKCRYPGCTTEEAKVTALKHHVKNTHMETNEDVCLLCGEHFPEDPAALEEHSNKHTRRHRNYVFSCKFCTQTWKNKHNVREHFKRVHPDLYEANEQRSSRAAKKSKRSGGGGGGNSDDNDEIGSDVSEGHDDDDDEKNEKPESSKRCTPSRLTLNEEKMAEATQTAGKIYLNPLSIKCRFKNCTFFTESGVNRLKRHIRDTHLTHLMSIEEQEATGQVVVDPSCICPRCGQYFSDEPKLEKHSKQHKGKTGVLFSCNYCTKTSLHKGTIYHHFQLIHPELYEANKQLANTAKAAAVCKDCLESFPNLLKLWVHYRRRHMDNMEGKVSVISDGKDKEGAAKQEIIYYCGFCPKGFSGSTVLRNHHHDAHSNEICFLPIKPFSSLDELRVDDSSLPVAAAAGASGGRGGGSSSSGNKVSSVEAAITQQLIQSATTESTDSGLTFDDALNPKRRGKVMIFLPALTKYILEEECQICQFPTCGHSAKNKSALEEHVKELHISSSRTPDTQDQEPQCICYQCGLPCSTEDNRNQHQLNAHSSTIQATTYGCKFCTQSFPRLLELHTHFRLKHKSICAQIFAEMEEESKAGEAGEDSGNVDVIHNQQRYECKYCQETFTLEPLWVHLTGKHQAELIFIKPDDDISKEQVGLYRCNFCPLSSNSFASLFKHLRTHHEHEIIGNINPDAPDGGVRIHASIPGQKKPIPTSQFICDQCGCSFSRSNALQKHLKICINKFTCEECGKTYNQKRGLEGHRIKCHGLQVDDLKNYKCTTCGKVLSSFESLRYHIRVTHNKEYSYVCHLCPYKCLFNNQLKRHMMVHNDEKPISCTVCNQRFRLQSKLNIHMRKHTGERPYVCRHCAKSFYSCNAWRRHEQLHGSSRTHQCPLCEMKYPSRNNLKGHLKSHHRNQEFRVGIRPKRISKYEMVEEESNAAATSSNSNPANDDDESGIPLLSTKSAD